MSVTYIPVELRRIVFQRAGRRCEYCLIHEDDAGLGMAVDHIVAEKHGGLTNFDNLALSCYECNTRKGSDLGSLTQPEKQLVRFFDPRVDIWTAHFRYESTATHLILALTDTGEVTARILGFNHPDRIAERRILQQIGRYP